MSRRWKPSLAALAELDALAAGADVAPELPFAVAAGVAAALSAGEVFFGNGRPFAAAPALFAGALD